MTASEYNDSVKLYADNLYRFALSNTRDEEKARDIVQDAFERMWIKHRDIEAEKTKSYLFTTAYHLFIDMSRREKKFGRMAEADLNTHYHTQQYSDLQEILHQAVLQLPPDQRAVVMLRDYEGYSYEEIGNITGLSESQVKVYIYRARTWLKKYIGKPEVVI